MHLSLIGHAHKYAVEQMLVSLFPEMRPRYDGVPKPKEAAAVISLETEDDLVRAHTKLSLGAQSAAAYAEEPTRTNCPEEHERMVKRVIRLSFYRAAKPFLSAKPAWGALTGIRPGKFASEALARGMSEREILSRFEDVFDTDRDKAELCIDTANASLAVQAALAPRDICLYIGIPFCPSRCSYCSFVSQSTATSLHLMEDFLSALALEIKATAKLVSAQNLRIRAIYIGGGTPTSLSAKQLEGLLAQVAESFPFSDLTEYTVEAGRPDTITREKLSVLKRFGVSRVSVNPQSMQGEVLSAIGRRHTPGDIARAVDEVRELGFKALNMDLIAGLPRDTTAGFVDSLTQVLHFAPENITVHTLSQKKGANARTLEHAAPSGKIATESLAHASEMLRAAQFQPFYLYRQKFMAGALENIGWCTSGNESFYNIAIMEELCPILGLGGGASTKLMLTGANAKNRQISRIYNPKYPYEYISGIDTIVEKKLSLSKEAF